MWDGADSLDVMLAEINKKAPNRSKASDGAIGDEAHATRDSDHNPWVKEGTLGIVTARDFTQDPGDGADMAAISEHLRVKRDPRIKYVIFNGRWFRSYDKVVNGKTIKAWTWAPYTGTNPHRTHMHVSVNPQHSLYDSKASWGISTLTYLTKIVWGTYAKGAKPGSRTVKKASAGDDVKFLQGKVGVKADGYFGDGTEQGVKKWQAAHRLTADGVVGPKTWASLLSIKPPVVVTVPKPPVVTAPKPPAPTPAPQTTRVRNVTGQATVVLKGDEIVSININTKG